MSARRRADFHTWKNLLRRGKKGSPLQAAGAISHVIGEKSVATQINRFKLRRFKVGEIKKGEAGMSELPETRFQESSQLGSVADFAVLPRRFQTGAVGKSAGGKHRICQLPQQPVFIPGQELRILRLETMLQNKEYR